MIVTSKHLYQISGSLNPDNLTISESLILTVSLCMHANLVVDSSKTRHQFIWQWGFNSLIYLKISK